MRYFMGWVAAVAVAMGCCYADWKASYRSYEEAIDRGDAAAAVVHAEAAWRDAKASLPPGENRAGLAQNFGLMVLFTDPAKGGEALEDAAAMAQQGFGTASFSYESLAFLSAYGYSAAAEKNQKKALAAHERALAVPPAEFLSTEMITAVQKLGGRLLSMKRYGEVISMQAPLLPVMLAREDIPPAVTAALVVQQTTALALDRPIKDKRFSRLSGGDTESFIEGMKESIRAFRRLANRFPVQQSIDEFDPNLAYIMAWEDLAYSYYRSYEREQRVDEFAQSLPRARSGIGRQTACGRYEWINNNFSYPSSQSLINGAVVVGFHFDDDGRVLEPRVLAEVPEAKFGRRLVKAMDGFKADVSGLHVACSRDHLYSVQFYVVE